jgi:uncharacterized membrane protein
MRKLIPYAVSLLVFVVLDAIWLTLTVRFYRAQLSDLLLPNPRIAPAVAFYLLQVLGIQLFVLPRAGTAASALAFGAAFGIFTYATYDLTNWAVLKNWTASLTVMDICWGAVVTAVASLAGFLVRPKGLL